MNMMVAPSQGILGAGSHPASHEPGSETIRAVPRAAISHIHSLFLEMRATKRPSSDQYKEAAVRMGYILCASRFWMLKEKPNAVRTAGDLWEESPQPDFICQTPKESQDFPRER